MQRSHLLVLALLFVIVSCVVGYTYFIGGLTKEKKDTSVSGQLQGGEVLPYTDLAGNPVDLKNFENNFLVINSWATWCPSCLKELPDLVTFAGEYKNQNVTVIAINRNEPPDRVRAFVGTLGNPADVLFLLDPNDTFYKTIGGFSMPETMFYRIGGEVAVHKRGFMKLDEMRAHIKTTLTASE